LPWPPPSSAHDPGFTGAHPFAPERVRRFREQDAATIAHLLRRRSEAIFSESACGPHGCLLFGQVPFLSDGALEIFESGAGLLHLARKSEKLMPRGPVGEAETMQWVVAALNSIEMVSVP